MLKIQNWLLKVAAVTLSLLGLAVASGSACAADGAKAEALVSEMRRGNLVLVFRNTVAEIDQTAAGPMLSDQGQRQAKHVGRMLRELHVPAHGVYASKSRPAVETARLTHMGKVTQVDALTDGGPDESTDTSRERVEAFHALLRTRPRAGTNTVLVADVKRIAEAIDANLSSMEEGELVVVRPNSKIERGFETVGHLRLRELRDYWREAMATTTGTNGSVKRKASVGAAG